MTPRKLSESDKNDLLNLYRQSGETTSTLAKRYDVSPSTISRILKSSLSEQEYEALVQQKRSGATKGQPADSDSVQTAMDVAVKEAEQAPITAAPEEQAPIEEVVPATPVKSPPQLKRRRTRSSAIATDAELEDADSDTQLPLLDMPVSKASPEVNPQRSPVRADNSETTKLQSMLEEELLYSGSDLADLEDEDEDLDDLDDEDDLAEDLDDDDEFADGGGIPAFAVSAESRIQVLPLSEAAIPKTFYLVIDRAADLIARPLRDFGDLGRIPAEEIQEKTLPIFDNHRVARRFSKRTQRVIKVPDGRMLLKTCSHLQAKGITRLLIDGQVYSLN